MEPLERHVRVSRSARYYVLGKATNRTRELWIACHGYAQLAAAFAKPLGALEDDARVVAVPEALNRFYLDDPMKRHGPTSPVGAGWMTREDREREIADYVEYLDAVTQTVSSEILAAGGSIRVTALGFSQGVATVCRWAALGKTPLDRLVLWAGSLPADLAADRGDRVFREASVVIVAGRQDQVLPVDIVEREHRALIDRGIPAELVLFDGAHSLHSETLRRLAGTQ